MIQNRFKELLARKERLEGRSISRRTVAEETSVSLSSVQKWASNSLSRYHVEQIKAFCDYFNCDIGDLIVLEENVEGQEETLLATA